MAKLADTITLKVETDGEYTGGSVNYYKIHIKHPASGGEEYDAECLDIIESLDMSFAEGEAFKAIWRLAAARLGKKKRGHEAIYDGEKAEFYSKRILVRLKNG